MKFNKILDRDGNSCNGGKCSWLLPTQNTDGTWNPGEWMPDIVGELSPCSRGYHVCNDEQLIIWINFRIFEAEVDMSSDIIDRINKLVCRRCRLTKEILEWTEEIAEHFVNECIYHVSGMTDTFLRTSLIEDITFPKLYWREKARCVAKFCREDTLGSIVSLLEYNWQNCYLKKLLKL